MLMRNPWHRRLTGQRGFTLPELLVAMSAAVVVVIGASTVMISALHTSRHVTDTVVSVQEGRTAMEQLLQELNSGCLANDVSPVQASTATGITPAVSSDATHLVFVSGLGDSATATPTEHVISIQSGALVDAAYASTGGLPPALNVAPTWTFNPTPVSRRIFLEKASQINGTTPLFSYLSYSNPSNTTANSLVGAAALTSLPLSTADAASVAEVDLAWQAAPNDGQTAAGQVIQMNDSAVFRLTPASPNGANYPCD
jgi:prepilin-type N-terminal cleavage/methylation domain-containing protein